MTVIDWCFRVLPQHNTGSNKRYRNKNSLFTEILTGPQKWLILNDKLENCIAKWLSPEIDLSVLYWSCKSIIKIEILFLSKFFIPMNLYKVIKSPFFDVMKIRYSKNEIRKKRKFKKILSLKTEEIREFP